MSAYVTGRLLYRAEGSGVNNSSFATDPRHSAIIPCSVTQQNSARCPPAGSSSRFFLVCRLRGVFGLPCAMARRRHSTSGGEIVFLEHLDPVRRVFSHHRLLVAGIEVVR